MAEIEKKPVKIVETVLRDAHQSLLATRMTTEQMLPIVDKMDKGLELLWKNVSPKYRVREFSLTLGEDNMIDGEVFQTKSKNLSVNLKDCEKIVVFAATLGVGADYLIQM